MTAIIERYPNIKKTALIMAYCNGMINRFESEEQFLAKQDAVLGADGVYDEDMQRLDTWLGEIDSSDPEALLTIADGDQLDCAALVATGPRNSDAVPLARIFEDMFDFG